MTNLLSTVPGSLALISFVVVPAAIAMVLHAFFRRLVPSDELIPHHDVAGFLVAVVGVLYAVVLGFLVVTVWTGFDGAQQNADLEAGAVGDEAGLAEFLPQPQRGRVQQLLAAYAVEVRDVEWTTLAQGRQDPHARALLLEAIQTIGAMPASTGNLAAVLRLESSRQQSITGLRDIADHRRLRLIQAQSRFPSALYLSLLVGAIVVMAFVFLFGVEKIVLQLMMTGLVAACIGLLFGLIFELDAPYSGAIRISADAWSLVIENNHFRERAIAAQPRAAQETR